MLLWQTISYHLESLDLADSTRETVARALASAVIAVLAVLANFLGKRIIRGILHPMVRRTRTHWDDVLLERKVFERFSHLAPAALVWLLAPSIFGGVDRSTFDAVDGAAVDVAAVVFLRRAALIYMVVAGLWALDSLINALVDIFRTSSPSGRALPIRGFVQVVKIGLVFAGIIVVLSLAMGGRPMTLIGGLGALTAVLLLVFKDAILGLVAGVQLTTNRMVRLGDWISMPAYDADGDVIDISLLTVKVQNWDKTISTIPSYALVSESFKNWRGMLESGGRRIMRSIHIDMRSIRFADEEMLEKFSRFQVLSDYIERKRREVAEHNRTHDVDDRELVNGRRLTNVGTFRAYITEYLKAHPKLETEDMLFLVRHLEPTPEGLPIQVYVFSREIAWPDYEAIQADVFDHILAVVPEFGLRVFQKPSGADLTEALQGKDERR